MKKDRHPCGPFDDSARERQHRMGLLTINGEPNQNALAVIARLYAGLFFDALCDFYSDIESVNAVCQDLVQRSHTKDPRLPFLAICSAYDTIYLPLPEPMWWMAGNLDLVTQFAKEFMKHLTECAKESEVMK